MLQASIVVAMPAPGERGIGEVGGVGEVGVSENTGEARLRIQIEVPPGSGGLEPNLAIHYSSHQGDGPYGVGWDFNLGEVRCSHRFGVPNYEYESCERFEWNGQLLTRDGTTDSYHPFIETFDKIEYLAASQIWVVTNPNGTIQRYGVDSDARIFSGGEPARWFLSEIEDPFGNTVFVSYDDTTDLGTRYPIRITYGPNATKFTGDRSIEIIFGEDRPDPIHDYVGGIEREITKRLTDIKVLSAGVLVRRYVFGYDGRDESGALISYTTGRSRLSWVQQFGSDCTGDITTCVGLPRQEYVYTDSKDDGTTTRYSKFDQDTDDPENYVIDFARSQFNRATGIRLADVNGDGLADVIEGGYKAGALRELQTPRASFNNLKVKLNTGSGFVEDPAWTAALGLLEVSRPRADFVQVQQDVAAGSVQEALHFNSFGIVEETPGSVQYSVVEHPLELAPQADMVRPEARYSSGGYDSLVAGNQTPGWIEGMGRLFLTDIDGDGLADIVVSVRLSGVDKVLDAQGIPIPSAMVQREPGLTVRKVYRNTGDPLVGWVEDDQLASGLPPFGVVQFESEYGTETKIPFGLGPDPADPFSGFGVPGSGLEVIWNQIQADACSVRGLYGGFNVLVPPAMSADVCINLIDLAPRFVDFDGDGFLDLMVLDLENPSALHQGNLFDGRGTGAPSVPANRARSQAWVQVPDAAIGEDRWVRAAQYDLPNVPFRSPEYGGSKSAISQLGVPWTDDEWILFGHSQPLLASGASPPPGCPGDGLFGSNQWEFCAPLSFNVDTSVRLIDLNRDGLTDVIWSLYDYYILGPDNYPDYPLIAQGVLLNTGTGWCSSVSEMAVHVESHCPEAAIYYPPENDYPQNPPQPFDPAGPSGFTFAIDGHTGPPSGHLVDLNADGFLDYIQVHNTEEYIGKKAWIFDPAGVTLQPPNVWIRDHRYDLDIDFVEIGEPPDPDHVGFALFDVNGDGAMDVVGDDLKDLSGNQLPQVFLGNSKHSDLIRLVRNGRGGEMSIGYESAIVVRNGALQNPPGSVDLEAAAKQHATQMAEALDDTPIADVVRWTTLPLVTETKMAGPNRAPDPASPGQSFGPSTKYRYAHPRYCTRSRSSLGFRVVEQTRPGGEIITSKFYQVHGRAGKTSQVLVSEAGNYIHLYQEYWETQEKSAQLPQPFGRPLVPASQAGSLDHAEVHVGRLARTRSYNAYTSGPGAISMRTYHYEDDYDHGYNFVEKIVEKRPTNKVFTMREPISDPANSIYGLVARRKILDHLPGGIQDDDFLKDTHFNYQKGRRSSVLDRVKRRDEGGLGADELHTLAYDAYGNLTKTTIHSSAGDRTTDFCYDGDHSSGEDASWCPNFGQDSHSIRVGVMDAAGGVFTFEPDAATGAIVETDSTYTDDPGSKVDLDIFGRPIASYVYDGSSWQRISKTVYDDLPFQPGVITQFRYAEAGAPDSQALWGSVVSDGLGGVWKEIGETPSGFVGTLTYFDPFARSLRTSNPIDCGLDASCANFDGAIEPVARRTDVDAVGRAVYSETPHGFSIIDYSAISSSLVAGPWPTSSNNFDVVLEKDGEGNLIKRGIDGDQVAWTEECDNTVLASATDLSSTPCTSVGSGDPSRTFYVYEATGEINTVFDPRIDSSWSDPNHRFVYHYDTKGRVVQIDDPALSGAGNSFTTYDSFGNIHEITNARLQTRSHAYDVLNRLIAIATPTSETDYTVSYRPSELQSSGDSSDSYQRTIIFDDLGRVQSERLAVRNASNRLQSFHTDFTYDLAGRVIEILYPAKHFDIFGWRDTVVRYEYDGEFIEQICDLGWGSDCDTATVSYVESVDFDSLGRLSSMTSPAGTRTFEYATDTHRLAKDEFISPAYQYSRNYDAYDGVGNILSISGSESAIPALDMNETYGYDQRNRLIQWTKEGTEYDYGYDDLGNLTMHAGEPQLYDDDDRPHAVVRLDLSASTPTDYSYDDDGNIESIVGSTTAKFFEFDSANQIVCLADDSVHCDTRVAYDVRGKRVAEYPPGHTFRAFVGDTFLFESYRVVDTASVEIMLAGKRIALKRFRPQLRAATMSLFAPRLPESWRSTGFGAIAGMTLMLLIGTIRNGRMIVFVPPRPLRTATALTTIALLFVPQVAFGAVPTNASPPTYYWELSDPLGTGSVLLDENGDRVRHQVFTPMGAIHDEIGAAFRSYYAGHRRDDDSGMYYMQARWYDPGSGSFLSIDPIIPSATDPQSFNPYSYARNNPLNLIDPDGMCWRAGIDCGINMQILGAAQTTTTTVTILSNGETVSEFSFSETSAVSGGNLDATDLESSLDTASASNSANGPHAVSGGFWQAVESYIRDFISDEILGIFGGPFMGNIGGIISSIYGLVKGIVTFDGPLIRASAINLVGASIMVRSGSTNGLGHGGSGAMQIPSPGTKIHNAATNHDAAMAKGEWFNSDAHYQYIRDAWTGPGRAMGPWGQAYRAYATVGLGIAGLGLATIGK